jgi:hypothetical protein
MNALPPVGSSAAHASQVVFAVKLRIAICRADRNPA